MIRSLGIALGALALCAASAGAVVVEIPLPALQGTYGTWPPTGPGRTAAFTLPQRPAFVRAVSIRLRGSTQVGRMLPCDILPDPSPVDLFLFFSSDMIDPMPMAGWVTGYCPGQSSSGPFDCTVAYQGYSFPPSPPPTWEFLADGQGELTLYIGDSNPFDCPRLIDPIAVIEEATLLVDADFAVPVLSRSWGRIKAAYR